MCACVHVFVLRTEETHQLLQQLLVLEAPVQVALCWLNLEIVILHSSFAFAICARLKVCVGVAFVLW